MSADLGWDLTEEERLLQATAREFAQREVAPGAIERDATETYDRSLFARMGALGLTGAPLPAAAGGAGFSYLGWSLVMEELGAGRHGDGGLAVGPPPLAVPGGHVGHCGAAGALAAGDAGRCGAGRVRADGAGRRVRRGRARSRAERVPRPRDGYALTGTKIWITNAPEAERYLVFATLDPALGSQRRSPRSSWSGGTPASGSGAREHKMGIRSCPASELVFERCFVPAANRLGEEGQGYRIALSALAEGRISIASACVGLAQSALDQAAAYLVAAAGVRGAAGRAAGPAVHGRRDGARRRRRHGRSPGRRRVPGTAASRWPSSRRWRSGPRPTWRCGSRPTRSSCSAGAGYSRETGVERLMRDAKGAQIYEGTNQIHRLIVADEVLKRAAVAAGG